MVRRRILWQFEEEILPLFELDLIVGHLVEISVHLCDHLLRLVTKENLKLVQL